MSFAVAILGLAVLILIHEAGHFFAARAVGMRPRKFYIGFPPALVKRNRGGVEYGIGAIPLGGYVKIPGMHRAAPGDLRGSLKPEDQEALAPELDRLDAALESGDDDAARSLLPAFEAHLGNNRMLQELDGSLADDAYWRQKSWKRIVVIGAGPFVNLVCALVLFAAVFMTFTTVPTRIVAGIEKGFPAAAAGLKKGDRVVVVAGKPVQPKTLPDAINATHGKPFRITVVRKGERLVLGPVRAKLNAGRYRIGIEIKGKNGPRRIRCRCRPGATPSARPGRSSTARWWASPSSSSARERGMSRVPSGSSAIPPRPTASRSGTTSSSSASSASGRSRS